jgi:hypothetical protein
MYNRAMTASPNVSRPININRIVSTNTLKKANVQLKNIVDEKDKWFLFMIYLSRMVVLIHNFGQRPVSLLYQV